MLKPLFILLALFLFLQNTQAQKKYINRKVAQKNYEGYMLMKEHKYDSALILFDRAIKDDAEAFFIYQNRAICKMHLKDTLGAIKDYKTNIKLEPQNAESKYALGAIYKAKKDSVKALKYFIPAIQQADAEFNQKKLLYMNNFAGHYFRLNHDYDSALVFYEHVKNYTPKKASVYINAAVCHFQLDSLDRFCANLEQAFVLGGSVNCIALKSYCRGCNHLLEARGKTDTLSRALDTRLSGIIPDTIYYPAHKPAPKFVPTQDNSRKIKVYYNRLWQMCLPENATYYRESFWTKHLNFFGGDFTDHYIDGQVYAKGRIESKKINGPYNVYYPNGKPKLRAQFVKGSPIGEWTFFLEDGTPDFEIQFSMDNFKIKILNASNTNYPVNSGTGKFRICIDKWDKLEFELLGELDNNRREGTWAYKQDGKKIIAEKYKKGKFKSGYVVTSIGNIPSNDTRIDALVFIPPQLTQVSNLFFDTVEAANHYSFIRKFGF